MSKPTNPLTRGQMGLDELTSYKWLGLGNGKSGLDEKGLQARKIIAQGKASWWPCSSTERRPGLIVKILPSPVRAKEIVG